MRTEKKKEYEKKYYQTHKEKLLKARKKWRNEHEKQSKEYAKEYSQKHRTEIQKYRKEYRQKHITEIQKQGRQYYQQHRVEDQERHQTHRYGSVERYNEAMLEYEGECAFACGKQAKMVHHKDGKSIRNSPREEVNNELSNLLPLCCSCHSWLHGLKKDNKGRFQSHKPIYSGMVNSENPNEN